MFFCTSYLVVVYQLISQTAGYVIPRDENVMECKSSGNKQCAEESGRVRIHSTLRTTIKRAVVQMALLKKYLFIVFMVFVVSHSALAEEEASKLTVTQEMLDAAQVELSYLAMGSAKKVLDQINESGKPFFKVFASVLATNGSTRTFSANKEDETVPTSKAVVALKLAMKKMASTGVLVCTGLFAPAQTPTKTGEVLQGISVELEHRVGLAMIRFFPIVKENDKFVLGQPLDRIAGMDMFENLSQEERLGLTKG